VLFSSARSGLTAVLDSMAVSRSEFVWVPKFSSHCVLEAIARVGTPTPTVIDDPSPRVALIYHQWGYISQPGFDARVQIIEDAVDSLLIPGRSPFAAGGRFVLWSLPKVFATFGGGVVFCKRKEDAFVLRTIRERRRESYIQAWLRWCSRKSDIAAVYWNGGEAIQGGVVTPLRRQVSRKLMTLEALVDERLRLLRSIAPTMALVFERSGRLPSNLAMKIPSQWERVWGPGGKATAGLRFFNIGRSYPRSHWEKVAPLPVHIDVSRPMLHHLLEKLEIRGDNLELHLV
jgi:putative PLP-dependent aminotransferase (TIGR04422 family)